MHVRHESRAVAMKPRDAAAAFRFKVRRQHSLQVEERSQASKASLQSSKHTGTKQNLTQNGDSKLFKVRCLKSVKRRYTDKGLSNTKY